MAKVKVQILKIIDMSYPIFIEFELKDVNDISHNFIDKVPVVSGDYDLVPPCIGYVGCHIVNETENTFIIDKNLTALLTLQNVTHLFHINPLSVNSE